MYCPSIFLIKIKIDAIAYEEYHNEVVEKMSECHAKFLTAEKDIQVCKVCGTGQKKVQQE
jgi:hypothetical protein